MCCIAQSALTRRRVFQTGFIQPYIRWSVFNTFGVLSNDDGNLQNACSDRPSELHNFETMSPTMLLKQPSPCKREAFSACQSHENSGGGHMSIKSSQ